MVLFSFCIEEAGDRLVDTSVQSSIVMRAVAWLGEKGDLGVSYLEQAGQRGRVLQLLPTSPFRSFGSSHNQITKSLDYMYVCESV